MQHNHALSANGQTSTVNLMRHAIVTKQAATTYAACVADLPGGIATGNTIEEVERRIREAVVFHLKQPRERGAPINIPPTLWSTSPLQPDQSAAEA